MKFRFQLLFTRILHLGCGEMMGRLCNVATVIWLGHRYGVVILGMYALAQTLAQYMQPVIDFGMRHVGARLVARYPEATAAIVKRVQRRRYGMAVAALPLILMYSGSARLPPDAQRFLLAFAVAGSFYAASLDWAAWGEGRMALVGLAKAFSPACILVFVLAGHASGFQVLWWAAAGNWSGFLLQAVFFRWWWKRQRPRGEQAALPPAALDSLAWRRTSIMGLAWLCYLAFNNVDMLMLGLLSTPEQVGLYGAAYRVLNQALATYYLLTQTLYPQFARHGAGERRRMVGFRVLGPLAAAGLVLAAGMILGRRSLLALVFGRAFLPAAPLVLLLAWSLPLDFLSSYLSNAFLAWGMERKVLAATGTGAVTNIVLNWILLPRLGAWGAALNTLLSYVVLLAALLLASRTMRETGPGPPAACEAGVPAETEFDAASCS